MDAGQSLRCPPTATSSSGSSVAVPCRGRRCGFLGWVLLEPVTATLVALSKLFLLNCSTSARPLAGLVAPCAPRRGVERRSPPIDTQRAGAAMPDFDVQHPLDISSTTEANPGYPHGDILPNYTILEKTERFRPIVGDVSVRTTHSTCPPSRFFFFIRLQPCCSTAHGRVCRAQPSV